MYDVISLAPCLVFASYACGLLVPTVSEANELFKVEWVKQEAKRERGEGEGAAAGAATAPEGDGVGKDARESKRQCMDSTQVAVKNEVKEEDSLDIGNVAKAFGDVAEGSDAITNFERLWADDPDKV